MNAVCSPRCTCHGHGTCISHAPGAAEALGASEPVEPSEPLELLAVAGGLGKAASKGPSDPEFNVLIQC